MSNANNEWQEFFNGHAPVYMENCFVTNTLAEVDFLIEELGIKPGDSVLDVGCGTGRHSVELAKRGYRMACRHSNDDVAKGEFDPLTLMEKTDAPVAKGFDLRERGYVPTEMTLLCRCAGLEVEHIWVGTAGNWGHRPIDLDEIEIMVVAHRPL